jgi:Flp pilus assembly protein TadG
MILQTRRPQPRRGTAIVEVTVVFTLLIPLLIGLWEVGRMIEVQQVLSNAAREGGRQAAAGLINTANIQQYVVNYLNQAGIPASTSNVTVTNLTSGLDPTAANQLDHFNVTINIPFNSVRWVLLNQITNVTQLTGTADWYSMRDIPVTINQTIPLS